MKADIWSFVTNSGFLLDLWKLLFTDQIIKNSKCVCWSKDSVENLFQNMRLSLWNAQQSFWNTWLSIWNTWPSLRLQEKTKSSAKSLKSLAECLKSSTECLSCTMAHAVSISYCNILFMIMINFSIGRSIFPMTYIREGERKIKFKEYKNKYLSIQAM